MKARVIGSGPSASRRRGGRGRGLATAAAALAVGALAGCMSAPLGMVDDKGRAFEQTIDAPVDANLEPLAAEPSIPIINDRVRLLGGGGGGGDSRAGGEPPSACQAERWQRLIGMSKADVAEESLPAASRVVDWGAVVTQDYRPERLNVQLDQGGRVYRVVCG